MPELHIIIKADGSVEIEGVGYSGTKCLEASQDYEKALGAVISRKKKLEIYSDEEEVANSNANRSRNRTIY